MEEEWRGSGVQPPVWVWRAGRRRHGEDGQGVEDCPRTLSLCGRIDPGDPVSWTDCMDDEKDGENDDDDNGGGGGGGS